MLRTWFRTSVLRHAQRGRRPRRPAPLAPLWGPLRLEALEDRLAPAIHVWTGAVSGSWANNANWSGGSPAGDNSADLVFPSNGANFSTTNDIATAFSVQTITFS